MKIIVKVVSCQIYIHTHQRRENRLPLGTLLEPVPRLIFPYVVYALS